MGTLSSCLKKIGLSEHEAAILRGSADENIKDGDAAQVAAVRAVADYLEQLEKERDGIAAQIAAKNGRITAPPFKLADLSELTQAIRKTPVVQEQTYQTDEAEEQVAVEADDLLSRKDAEDAAAAFDEAVAEQLAKFLAGDFKLPSNVSGVGKEGRAAAEATNRQRDIAYAIAAKKFLEGELVTKAPGKKADTLNTEFLANIKPRPIAKRVGKVKDLASALKALNEFAADEKEIRYYLRGVHFDDSGKLVATNGNRLVILDGFDTSAAPARPVPEKGHSNSVLGRDNKWIDGVFPDWQRIVTDHKSETQTFNSEQLGDLARGLMKAQSYTNRSNYPLMRLTIGGVESSLNVSYVAEMADSFRKFGHESIVISIVPGSGNGIVATSEDQNLKHRIMGMRDDPVTFAQVSPSGFVGESKVTIVGEIPDYAKPALDQANQVVAKETTAKVNNTATVEETNPEPEAATKQVKDENGNTATEVTLPSGKVVQIQRLNSTESMGLPGWHGPDGYLADTKDGAIKELVARDGKSSKVSFGEKVESGFSSKEFDKWIAEKVKKQPEQLSGNGDHGVGYIALSGADNGYKTVQGVTSPRVVQDDQRDMRLVFRLDSGDLVWWNSDDSNVYRVEPSDPRLTINMAAPVESNNASNWYSVQVDGEEYSISTSKPLEELDDDEFADELLMRGYEGKVSDEFRKLRADATAVDAEKAPEANAEPNPLDYTPKQYHEAMLQYMADRNDVSMAEVRENYDTEAGRNNHNQDWINAVRSAARDGQEISRQMLDKLHELNANAVAELMHDYPEAKIPEGYQTPAGRQVEKQNAEDKKADRAAAKKSADAGEELTYNKRNRRKGGLLWGDIADKNATLQAKEVVKVKVYPKPDYQALVDGGMKPMIAHLIKQIYDSIAAKPALRRGEVLSEESMKAYINGVNRVMDGVMAWANNPEAIASWAGRNARMLGSSFNVMDTFSKNDTPLYFVYPNGWKEQRAEVNYLGGNKFYGALQPGSEELNRANRDLKLGWPSKAEAWQKQGYKIIEAVDLKTHSRGIERAGRTPFVYVSLMTAQDSKLIANFEVTGTSDVNNQSVNEAIQGFVDNYNNKFVLQDKVGRVVGIYDTNEEAEEAARNAVKKVKEDGEIKEIGRVVTEVQRVGADRRMEGQDVSAQDLISTFGFRGVNFGNSMQGESKALVKERQLHLNHIYDAFMDLAELLNVPPKAMSLNGMLGIAVGAQGSGKALAHFVPGINEINITRRAGAGALAHEWGHALDHYFATQAGLSTRERPYLTSAVSGAKQETVKVDGKWVTRDIAFDGVRPEIADQFRTIVQTMQKRKETPEERIERLEQAKELAFEKLQSWLNFYRREVKKEGGEKADAALAKIDDIERRAKSLEIGDGTVAISKKYAVAPLMIELGQVYEDATGKKADPEYLHNTHYYLDRMKVIDGQLKADTSHDPAIVDTSYYRSSKSADANKKDGYWATPLEMFARAFDAYVVDSLAEKEAKNEYLGGIEAVAPSGEERQNINRAFDFLIAELKTKETDKGVAIYNLTDDAPIPESEWLSEAEILSSIEPILQKFRGGDIPVRIIENANEVLPDSVSADNGGGVSGFVYKGTIHLVRSGLPDTAAVVRTLFHELLHFGIRRFMSRDQYIEAMQKLYAGDPKIRDMANAWLNTKEAKDLHDKTKDDDYVIARGVDEALAAVAEEMQKREINKVKVFNDTKKGFLNNVRNWMVWLARKFGFDAAADFLAEKPTEQTVITENKNVGKVGEDVRNFILSIFNRLEAGEAPTNPMRSWAYADAAFAPVRAWHGSPHDHNKFDSSKIGTGEGAQAYGYGHYFADRKELADVYRRKLIDEDGNPTNNVERSIQVKIGRLNDQIKSLSNDDSPTNRAMIAAYQKRIDELDRKGKLYQVTLPEESTFLLWDKPLSEQSDSVRKALSLFRFPDAKMDGGEMYAFIRNEIAESSGQRGRGPDFYKGFAKEASMEMKRLGINGIKYLDGQSRSDGEGSFNYVVFDDADIQIDAKYSKGATHSGASPQDIRNTLNQRFGESGIRSMERAGVLKIMRLADAPEDIRRAALQEGASALYTEGGVAYLFSDRMTPEQAPGKLLHELGEHHGLERMLGADGWQRLMRRLTTMAKVRGSVAQGAWDGVKANYGEFNGMSDQELAGNERFIHEVLAALGENAEGQKTSLLREIVATVKAWLAERGFLIESITEADIGKLIEGSLKKVMRESRSMPAVEIDAAYNEAKSNVIDFWKEFKDVIANPGRTESEKKSTSRRLYEAFSRTQRGGVRHGRVSDNEGVFGEEVIDYAGEPIAGVNGYNTVFHAARIGKGQSGFMMYVVPHTLSNVDATTSKKELADNAALQFQFIHEGGDKYTMGISEPIPGTKAFNFFKELGRIEVTDKFDADGNPYHRLIIDSPKSTMKALMTEAFRRLAVVHGGVPDIEFVRETGATAGGGNVITYSGDTLTKYFSKTSMVAPETIEQTVLDNFRQIVDAMKSAKQLVEDCA